MNAKNLNGMPDHRANLSRTGFDMSQEFAFTSSVGMILPVYQDFLNVGESVHFSGDLITRTQPLVTAAMCDIDVWLDWFFVPISMLATFFPSKRWLTNDYISDIFAGLGGDDKLPVFNITGYLSQEGEVDLEFQNQVPSVFYRDSPYSDVNFERFGKSSFRLANHLGYNPYAVFHGSGSASTSYAHADNPNVFPMFPLAYQAIFQDYYRLPLDNFVKREVQSFNVDSYYSSPADPILDVHKSLFLLHYRPRHFDYFTGYKVSPLLSDVNTSVESSDYGIMLSKIDSFLDNSNPALSTVSRSVASESESATQVKASDSLSATAQLRNMFAVEKLLRVTGRAKKDYDSQVLAHFGFKVPHDVKHELTHICQQHSIIHIGEVISTSDTVSGDNGSALGAIGGKGYGVINSKKPYRFTAPVDGVFMCCYSSAPRQRYFGTFDKQNAITDRLSFYQPEYDKLGMQPLFMYEATGYTDDASGMADRIGWQYRYEQWKRKYNRVSEAFAAPGIYDQTINNNVSWVNATRPYASAFGYVPSQTKIGLNGYGLFVQPTDINQIMIVPYVPAMPDAALHNAPVMFYTDPFIHAFRANVKKVSVMSSFGEPDLNGI